LRKTTFLLATTFLCAACAGPATSAKPTTGDPVASTAANRGDAPLIPAQDMVCETVRPTGSNIAERTCRPRANLNQTNQGFPVYTPPPASRAGGG